MRQPSKDTIDYYIFPNKIMCVMLGMWPCDKKRSAIRTIFAYLHFMISVSGICIIMVPEILLIATEWNNVKIFARVGCVAMSLVQMLFKMFYLTARREMAHKLYRELRTLWYMSNDPEERQSYEVFAYWARTVNIAFISSCFGTITLFTISAMYDYLMDENILGTTANSRHLPYDTWSRMEFMDSPEFEIIFVCQVLGSIVCCFACGLDGTCMVLIMHISGQFRLITKWLSNIGIEMEYKQIDLYNCPPNVTAGLIRCIHHHQRLIKLVKDVNSLLTPIIFMQILTSSLAFCLGGYAILSHNTVDEQFKYISYLLSISIQLLLLCWPGEILVQESLDVGYAVYAYIPWYKLPPFYGRQVCLIALRSQKYCNISAFIFHSLSIYTLTNVLNTAFSYFALLRQVQDKTT